MTYNNEFLFGLIMSMFIGGGIGWFSGREYRKNLSVKEIKVLDPGICLDAIVIKSVDEDIIKCPHPNQRLTQYSPANKDIQCLCAK